ncbi:hypothetical protein Gpo141_00001604 [Globisporangium polare]
MGCCFSREDDRFDGSESLLPKGKLAEKSVREEYAHIDVAKKAANNGAHVGGYTSPEPSLTVQHAHVHSKQQQHNHSNGHEKEHGQQQSHASPPPKAKTVVESVDLLGLNKPESPSDLSAEAPPFQPLSADASPFQPHVAVPVMNVKPPAPATTTEPAKSVSPQKPAPKPVSPTPNSPPKVVETPKPVEVSAAHVALPPSIEKPASASKPLERKLSSNAEAATSGSTDDNENDDNDNGGDEKTPSTASSSASKKSKKKKKKGKK